MAMNERITTIGRQDLEEKNQLLEEITANVDLEPRPAMVNVKLRTSLAFV